MRMSLAHLCGRPDRVRALRRFAVTVTIITVLGHIYLGLETSYAATVVSVLTACGVQLLLEWLRCAADGCVPGYRRGHLIDFLLPPYITGMTCALFLFANGRQWPIVFAATLAIASKFVFRVRQGDRTRHFLNPSNFAILATLLAFPSVSLIMPYSLSAGLDDFGDAALPAAILIAGCLLNGLYTKRLVLVLAWFGAFILQALARHFLFDAQLLAMIAVATGPIAIMFSFYMISDPGTTPDGLRGQIAFGAAVGALYFVLTVAHVVYGLFWALFITCAIRGLYLFVSARRAQMPNASFAGRGQLEGA